MPSIDILLAALRAALDQTRHLAAGIGSSSDLGTEVRDRIGALGADGSAVHLGRAVDSLDEGRAQAHALGEGLERAIATAEAARTGTGGGGGIPPRPPPVAAASAPEPRPFKPMRTDPEKADEIRPYVGQPVAYATLYDEHGRQLIGVHNAGDDGPARGADWHEPWGSFARLRRHVEPHAAARMQRDGHRQLAMYVNMKPCSYPDGCEANLRDIIPEGAVLWVHQVRRSGTTIVTQYRGTGRAIKDD